MKQIELRAPEDIRLVEVPRPSPGPHELLVAVAQVGICGSDLHAYHGRHPFIELPVVPGHEFAGTVVEAGVEVYDYVPGQRVTVEPSLVCGVCYNCTHGRYNICEELKEDFSTALELLQDGKVKVDPLITHRFPLHQAAEAFATADSREGALKILVEVSPLEVLKHA
jgi:L-iditol 2-dehydrogenase